MMEPEIHVEIPHKAPKTPERSSSNSTTPTIVNRTPWGKHAGSHADDKVPPLADVVNQFLEDDLAQRTVFSMDEFATIILNLPKDWQGKLAGEIGKDSKQFNEAFDAYLQAVKRKGKEKRLYHPLAKLLNSIGLDSKTVIGDKAFYVQDPRPVLGSLIQRRPDLGVIYFQLLKLTERKDLTKFLDERKITGVFWGLLLYFIEVKDDEGHCLDERCGEECCKPKPAECASNNAVDSRMF